uniref:Guanylate cyclase n=1 Tax=Rhabditophanes sp. KR3021 TaxID=114890 RepID=A0AC35U7X7_9BILA
MLGYIHLVLKDLVICHQGQALWDKIALEHNLDDDFCSHAKSFKDEDTFLVIGVVARELNLSLADALEAYGEHFIVFVMNNGWDTILNCVADDVFNFLNTVTYLHTFMDTLTFKGSLEKPSFYCEINRDNSLKLHYYSHRNGLDTLVIGLVRKAVKELFNIDVLVTLNEHYADNTGFGKGLNHSIFRIETVERDKRLFLPSKMPNKFQISSDVEEYINVADFAKMCPTHICFNKNMIIEHCGLFLIEQLNIGSMPTKLSDIIEILSPRNTPLSFQGISGQLNSLFTVQLRKTIKRNKTVTDPSIANSKVVLKGKMMMISGGDYMLFLNSIEISTVKELTEKNIYLNDMALYDVKRDVVLLQQSRTCQQLLNSRLETTVQNLKKMTAELDSHRSKSSELLYDAIPPQIASVLKQGHKVEPCEYDNVSCLVCDIPYFAMITTQIGATEIMKLMNKLFKKYEKFIIKYECIKVVSFMDLFIITCGVPEPKINHASNICDLGMCLLWEVQKIKVPHINLPLLIRIGISTGHVVAGLIGTSHIRFSVIGETINVARTIATYSKPGKILISNTTKQSLSHTESDYNLENNGFIKTQTKKAVYTHFLISNEKKSLWQLVGRTDVDRTSNGYDLINDHAIASDWQEMETVIQRQENVIGTLRSSKNRKGFRVAAEKIRAIRLHLHNKLNNESLDSGISQNSESNQSSVCNIC